MRRSAGGRRPTTRAALCLAFSLLAAAMPSDHALSPAAEKIRAADYASAVSLLLSLPTDAEQAPELRAEARLMLGYSYFQLKIFGNAAQVLAEAASRESLLQGYARYYSGRARMELGENASAVPELELALGANPSGSLRAKTWYALARAQLELKNFPAALSVLERLDQDKGRPAEWSADLLWLWANALDQAGRPSEAGALLRRLWVEFPQSPPAKQAESILWGEGAGRWAEVRITDQDREERIGRLLNQGAFSQALREMEPLVQAQEEAGLSPEQEINWRWRRAKALAGLRRYAAAADEYERIFRLSGETEVAAAYQLARTWDRMGRKHQALAAYEEVWTRFPHSEQARWSLYWAGRLHQLDLEHEPASRWFEFLSRTYPGLEPADEARFQLGWMLYLERRYPEALAWFEQVPEREQDQSFNARTLYWRARALDRIGQAEPAQALRQQLLMKYPATAYSYLARHFHGVEPSAWPPADRSGFSVDVTAGPLDLAVVDRLIGRGMILEAQDELRWWERKEASLSKDAALQLGRAFSAAGDYFAAQRRVMLSFAANLSEYQARDREVWELAYPWAFRETVLQEAGRQTLDPRLVLALIRAESTYQPTIRSSAGAVGLMQIMPATGRQIARGLKVHGFETHRLENPELNIRFGCYYLRQLLDRYAGRIGRSGPPRVSDLVLALAAYNAGERRVDEWRRRFDQYQLQPDEFIEQIPFSETRNYVKRVLAFYQVYSLLYPRL